MLHYLVSLSDPEGHYIDVKLQIAIAPAEYVEQKRELILWLPTWIPGSYLIREFSRNIVSFSASLIFFNLNTLGASLPLAFIK